MEHTGVVTAWLRRGIRSSLFFAIILQAKLSTFFQSQLSHFVTETNIMSSADDQYEQQNDVTGGDVPSGNNIDNDYTSRTGQYQIPVQKDEAPVEDPINPDTADSDQTLGMLT